jgi:alkane 1-monooxygenase
MRNWHKLRYLFTFIGPCLGFVGLTGSGIWCWSLVLFGFVLIPLLELLMRPTRNSMGPAEQAAAEKDPFYDLLLYALVPMQWALLWLFLSTVGQQDLSSLEMAGRVGTMGMLCGVYGINVAHELGHRRSRWERVLARALLLTSLYMHFIVEHNRGHHRRVATQDDPASARFNEPIFSFWPRTLWGSLLSAWHIERERLQRAGKPTLHWTNEMMWIFIVQTALLLSVAYLFGTLALLAFLGAALVGALLLETVNYIEHYGLARVLDAQGRPRKVDLVHSWNSDHLLGRLMLLELTRHSDHHYKSSKKYQLLGSAAESPQLPTGYPGMMLLSLFPPLWFRVVNPRLEQLVAGSPQLRLARY